MSTEIALLKNPHKLDYKVDSSMSPAQIRALDIYLESATLVRDWKPYSFEEIAKILESEELKGSSSSIQRWSKKYKFELLLQNQIKRALASMNDEKVDEKALDNQVRKQLVDIKRNNELTADAYELMELFMAQTMNDYDTTQRISSENIKIVKDIAVFTGGREDKLLDRMANIGEDKLTSEEIKKEHEAVDIEIEEDDE